MAAPKGNGFWRLRSKHGRDKIFSSGEMILAAADEYMEVLQDNPLMEHDFVGKDAVEVDKRKKNVPTWEGFANFCDVYSGHFHQLKQDYKKSEDPVEKDIYQALKRVDDMFFNDKFTAAAAGLANANLIGKALGIVERVDHTTNGDSIKSVPVVLSNGKSLDDLMNELNPE